MQVLERPFGSMHVRVEGPAHGPALVFGNSLGTDLRLWDGVAPLLPAGLRLVRFDKRGHGLSDFAGDFSIEDLADDAAALIETFCAGPVVFVGLSIGGLVAQALAARTLLRLRGLVLSNTAPRIGTAQSWQDRITTVETAGLAAIADGLMERWFAPAFRGKPAMRLWRNMLERTSATAYAAACRSVAMADYEGCLRTIAVPTLAIAGEHDGSTPAALVSDMARHIPRCRFDVLAGTAHLPCVEDPAAYAALLTHFLQEIGHV
jgi:3-oxoadipate enol-lactonase